MAQVGGHSSDWPRDGTPAPRPNHTSDSGATASVVLQLARDSFLTMPAYGCVSTSKLAPRPAHNRLPAADTDKLCLIDWNQVRVGSQTGYAMGDHTPRGYSYEHAQEEAQGKLTGQRGRHAEGHQILIEAATTASRQSVLASDLFSYLAKNATTTTAAPAHHHQPHHDHYTAAPPSMFAAQPGGLEAARANDTNYQLARVTYLSAGSLLSLVGIFTNLLILLIIFINTKQKCHNILGRGQRSHTNYHTLLLFQLTVTGLLLASYILIDNINLYNNMKSGAHSSPAGWWARSELEMANSPTRTHHFAPPPRPHIHQHHDSFLSIYLPPTPFKRQQTELASSGRDANTSRRAGVLLSGANNHATLVEITCQPGRQLVEDVRPAESSPAPAPSAATIMLFNLVASIHLWTIVALAYDRYCAIAHPLEYLRSINAAKARAFFVTLWLAALLINVLIPATLDSFQQSPMEAEQAVRLLEPFELGAEFAQEDQEAGIQSCTLARLHPARYWIRFVLGGAGGTEQLDSFNSPLFHSLSFALSIAAFVCLILAPLVIVTICNMSIYGIVKVHERRMSASSGSLGHAASLCQQRLLKRDSLHTNNTDLNEPNTSSTSSISSAMLGKLIRASAHVGMMGGLLVAGGGARDTDTSSQCSSSNEHEISRLISGAGASSSSSAADHRQAKQAAADCCKAQFVDNSNTDAHSFRSMSSYYSMEIHSFKSKLERRSEANALIAPTASSSIMVQRLTKRSKLAASPDQRATSEGEPKRMERAWKRDETSVRTKLKRKLSDRDQVAGGAPAQWASCSCKSSITASEQTLAMQEPAACAADNYSCCSGQSAARQPAAAAAVVAGQQAASCAGSAANPVDSVGIMHQLKLAGLSFAGIAISELVSTRPEGRPSRPLNRSSSCSLGNLATMNGRHTHSAANCCCGVQQAASGCHDYQQQQNRAKRLMYVSQMLDLSQRDNGWRDKFCTRLLPDSDFESQQQPHPPPSGPSVSRASSSHQQQQHFNLGGTKSASFNTVVWLVLLMLGLTLPQFVLISLRRLQRAPAEARPVLDLNSTNLTHLIGLINSSRPARNETTIASDAQSEQLAAWTRAVSIWLDCACRLLFLLMIPANGWLYGIRSRSIRRALKMVLKRYISKKQASIEIDQRRKSTASTRSRDSSICGSTNVRYAHQFEPQHACSPQLHGCQYGARPCALAHGRVFRRCASFNLPPQTRQDYYNSTANELASASHERHGQEEQDDEQEQEARELKEEARGREDQELSTKRVHHNSIRFDLVEQHDKWRSHERGADLERNKSTGATSASAITNCLSIPAMLSSRFSSSRSSSLDLAGSLDSAGKNSLLSASIQSSQSAVYLLLDQKRVFESFSSATRTPQGQQAPGRPLVATKLTSALKKRNSSSTRRQQSCDPIGTPGKRHMLACKSALARTSSPGASLAKSMAVAGRHAVSFGRTQSLDRDKQSASRPVAEQAIDASDTHHRQAPTSQPPLVFGDQPARHTARALGQPPPAPANSIEGSVEAWDEPCDSDATAPSQRALSRKCSSDIKFVLTSAGDQAESKLLAHVADQQDAEPTDGAMQLHPQIKEARESGHMLAGVVGQPQQRRQQQQQQTDYQHEYYKQIKEAISKYFLSLKGRQSQDTRKSSRIVRTRQPKLLRHLSDITNSSQERRALASRLEHNCPSFCNCGQSQVGVAKSIGGCSLDSGRQRERSLDSQSVKLALARQLEGGRQEQDRRSMGLNGFEDVGQRMDDRSIAASHSFDSIQSEQFASQHGHSANSLQAPPPPPSAHLKPPNFLKLMLSAEGQTGGLYSSSLALSPIKECSSNHSCASSQSSLNLATSNSCHEPRQAVDSKQLAAAAACDGASLKNLVQVQ